MRAVREFAAELVRRTRTVTSGALVIEGPIRVEVGTKDVQVGGRSLGDMILRHGWGGHGRPGRYRVTVERIGDL
ncbi:MAG TPA: hypothetical protein VGL23_07750 [Chloroflexota bacterium]